ncbi:hypothetical protein Sru01_05100 [Sphaerisporangium rufum]|uniref:Histidine kinase/HSP90-like ATPase domain-containing protein n=1 Tax=Sphaerisporangium rufum TaxID=1381558 RepID=A0A919QX97_9ACTN|nr:ATP-binding protein [Sphaerisporangium rufum]GII75528.1 hypothetical protein Sru01_05100 [Sphaerisporangium rufum]
MAGNGARTAGWEVPDDLAAVGKVRGMVRDVLAEWGLAGLADDVVLVAGELLANASTHGRPPVRLGLAMDGGRLLVQVTDHGAGRPRRLDLGTAATHGRGLAIVAALADEYGTARAEDMADRAAAMPGKTVWASWHVPAR